MKKEWFVVQFMTVISCIIYYVSGEIFHCLKDKQVSTIKDASGTIHTLYEGETHYETNQECAWVIDVATNNKTKIQLTVTKSDLEWTPEHAICNGYDHMEIRKGGDQYSELQLSWCGEHNPYSIITEGPLIYIGFKTNDRQIYQNTGITLDFNTFTLSSQPNSCPSNWHEHNGNCYSLQNHQETWISAQEYCRYQQANIVSFQNDEEADFVIGLIQDATPARTEEDYWIGLSDIAEEGKYQWINNIKSLAQERWINNKHEPDRYFDCVSMRTSDGKWTEQYCTGAEVRTLVKFKFICKRQMDKETALFNAPEEKDDPEGEGKVAAGKRYIIAGIIIGALLVIGVIIAVVTYRRYGDTIKEHYRQDKRTSNTRATEEEAIRLPPYNPNPPEGNITPPPPYTPSADVV